MLHSIFKPCYTRFHISCYNCALPWFKLVAQLAPGNVMILLYFISLPRCHAYHCRTTLPLLLTRDHSHNYYNLMRDKLHWLRAGGRVDLKLCLLVYKAVHGLAPDYIAEMCLPVGSVEARRRLRSPTTGNLIVHFRRCYLVLE